MEERRRGESHHVADPPRRSRLIKALVENDSAALAAVLVLRVRQLGTNGVGQSGSTQDHHCQQDQSTHLSRLLVGLRSSTHRHPIQRAEAQRPNCYVERGLSSQSVALDVPPSLVPHTIDGSSDAYWPGETRRLLACLTSGLQGNSMRDPVIGGPDTTLTPLSVRASMKLRAI
jgi:hypothetical protein